MKKRILLADDNINFGMMLQSFLHLNGFEVIWTKNGNEAMNILQTSDFDLCILDVMMPQKDGFTLAEEMKKAGKNAPFIFLTAKGLKEDKIKGFKTGAIDYLVKPFDPEILILKIEALFSQIGEQKHQPKIIEIGSFQFNAAERSLVLGKDKQKLSPKESELLQLLIERKDKVVPREEALLKIWKDDGYFTTQSMNVFVTKLRSYLSKDPNYKIEIENIRGNGFILRVSTYQ